MFTTYKIGVDGGGSKTELILLDSDGTEISRLIAAGCNPSQVGGEQARSILRQALEELTKKYPGPVSHSILCMAGNGAFWRETAAALQNYGAVTALDDSLPVLELATNGRPGLVLHAGTGSFVAARGLDGSIHYAGGLGWKFGDPGSGFDLGRRALAAALLELQSAKTPDESASSPLIEALREHTGLTDYSANSRFFYHDAGANAKVASFAPRVLALAEKGDLRATDAVNDSVRELARQADLSVKRLFPHAIPLVACGISGRILNSAPAAAAIRAEVEKLKWPVELKLLDTPPIEGVRQLLAKIP